VTRTAGVSGLAVGLATAGGLLLFSGLKGVSIPDAVRGVLSTGQLPAPAPSATPVSTTSGAPLANGGASGSPIADAALKYQGKVPYKWGGADPSGWDCSGFVTWVLHHDLGYNLPSNTHTVCMQFYGWSGASKVTTPMVVQPGDLVVWPSHMGIAVSSTEMISAENPHSGTKVDTFQNGGPVPYSTPTFMRVHTNPFVAGG